jgi:DNA processing protein
MAGLSQAVLIIEAEEKSGTLITARMATDYNRDVLVVPGSIFSPASYGTNSLLRLGATPITSIENLLESLHLEKKENTGKNLDKFKDCSEQELQIIEILYKEPLARDELLQILKIPSRELNSLLSIMEIKGLIKEEVGQMYMI